MNSQISFKILPPPAILRDKVECFRIADYHGDSALSIRVCMNGLPGIVFQHHNGQSPVESISTSSDCKNAIPCLYVYGQTTEAGTLKHKNQPYKMIQVILKPDALHALLGINASMLTNDVVSLAEFSDENLLEQLLEADTEHDEIRLINAFLLKQLKEEKQRDLLIEESLKLIQRNIYTVRVKSLLETLSISERQFERRFQQAVGVSPQFYIGVRRFNEAMHLMKRKEFARLTDIAHTLNFYDQSHFIRSIKEFSDSSPKQLFQQIDDFYHDSAGYFRL
jgi:AraC-like DNA-binding protein